MRVALDEARDREPTVEVDHAGLRTDQRCDVGVAAGGGDPVAADRERTDDAEVVVDGGDDAVADPPPARPT